MAPARRLPAAGAPAQASVKKTPAVVGCRGQEVVALSRKANNVSVKSQNFRKKQAFVYRGISFPPNMRFGGSPLRILCGLRQNADQRHEVSITLHQLADQIDSTIPTCSRAINQLIADGIISRRRDTRKATYRISDQYWHDDIEEIDL